MASTAANQYHLHSRGDFFELAQKGLQLPVVIAQVLHEIYQLPHCFVRSQSFEGRVIPQYGKLVRV